MKRIIIAALLVLVTLPVFAQTVAPRPETFVSDTANILSPGARTELARQLHDYTARTGNEFAVLTVSSLGGFSSVEELANKTFHVWGIGKAGTNNGLLLVVSMAEHKFRLEVGYGLEGALPDGRAGKILRETIPDNFRAGRFDAGIMESVNAVIAHLDKAAEPPAPVAPSSDGLPWFWIIGILSVSGFVGFAIAAYVKSKRDAERAEAIRQEMLDAQIAASRSKRPRAQYTSPAHDFTHDTPRRTEPAYVPVPVVVERHDDSPSYSSSSSSDSGYSSSSSFDSSSSFGGGDSGGGGASGSW